MEERLRADTGDAIAVANNGAMTDMAIAKGNLGDRIENIGLLPELSRRGIEILGTNCPLSR